MTKEVVSPVLNLNGTSADSLLENYRSAYQNIQKALESFALCTPHGRDFQTAGDANYRLARQQHEQRIKQLVSIKEDIETIILQLMAQKAEGLGW